MSMIRRTALSAALAAVAALGLAACSPSGGAGGGAATGGASQWEQPTDIPMGSADAKVVLVEYASITCPHCANFHQNVLPAIKERYIDTGRVRYVFREFPTPPMEWASAGHLIARCAGPERRDGVIDALMRQQQEIARQASGPTGIRQALLTIAQSAGMSEADFDTCLRNSELLGVLRDVRQHGIDTYDVRGTPYILINGVHFEGPAGREINVDDMTGALDAALAAAG